MVPGDTQPRKPILRGISRLASEIVDNLKAPLPPDLVHLGPEGLPEEAPPAEALPVGSWVAYRQSRCERLALVVGHSDGWRGPAVRVRRWLGHFSPFTNRAPLAAPRWIALGQIIRRATDADMRLLEGRAEA